MKRAKVFLTLATGVLAIAAFAASKAAKISTLGHVKKANCPSVGVNYLATITPGSPTLRTASNVQTLYTASCVKALYQGN